MNWSGKTKKFSYFVNATYEHHIKQILFDFKAFLVFSHNRKRNFSSLLSGCFFWPRENRFKTRLAEFTNTVFLFLDIRYRQKPKEAISSQYSFDKATQVLLLGEIKTMKLEDYATPIEGNLISPKQINDFEIADTKIRPLQILRFTSVRILQAETSSKRLWWAPDCMHWTKLFYR